MDVSITIAGVDDVQFDDKQRSLVLYPKAGMFMSFSGNVSQKKYHKLQLKRFVISREARFIILPEFASRVTSTRSLSEVLSAIC